MIPDLQKKGAIISYFDPTGQKKEFNKFKKVTYYNSINKACKNVELIIIHTEWNDFKSLNLNRLSKFKNVSIFDMRNILSQDRINKSKIKYYSIGS